MTARSHKNTTAKRIPCGH